MSDIDKLKHYLAAWELSNPQLLRQTFTSDIYTVTHGTETVVLKLLSPSETEEQRGALSLRYFHSTPVQKKKKWRWEGKGSEGSCIYNCNIAAKATAAAVHYR